MKGILLVILFVIGIYLFISPFKRHFKIIELQNETIIRQTDSLFQLTKELEKTHSDILKHIEK